MIQSSTLEKNALEKELIMNKGLSLNKLAWGIRQSQWNLFYEGAHWLICQSRMFPNCMSLWQNGTLLWQVIIHMPGCRQTHWFHYLGIYGAEFGIMSVTRRVCYSGGREAITFTEHTLVPFQTCLKVCLISNTTVVWDEALEQHRLMSKSAEWRH